MPIQSHPIKVTVYGQDNSLLNDASVILTLNSDSISGTTSEGYIVLNTANLANGWNVGDEISITATKLGKGTITSTLVLTSQPQEISLTLEESSSLIYAETENQHMLNFALLTDFAGDKITSVNPLPIKIMDSAGINVNAGLIKKMQNLGSGQPQYIGEALPGTLTSEAKWRIRKMEYDNGENMPPTGELFASGNANYDKIWDNRSSYNYS